MAGKVTDERARHVRRTSDHAAVPVRPAEPVAEGLAALHSALDTVFHRIVEEWPVRHSGPASDEVRFHCTLVLEAIRQASAGGDPDYTQFTRRPLGRHLLDMARGFLLDAMSGSLVAPDGVAVVHLLGAMETVLRGLDPDSSMAFSDQLSGPNGLELVVEVAHDIRSPLTSILFLAETLQRGRSGQINNVQERQLGLVYSAAFGLSAMASDVIELARGGDRLVDLDPIPFSVSDILESVRDIVLPIAEEKGLGVRLSPPGSDFRTGHPVALSRVLLNLTTNALKFTDEGQVEVHARQTTRTGIEFSVRDTGRGIPEEAMETLFQPFRRRQKSGDFKFSGAGLGLSICRKLVEAMGSELKIETSPDAGTRFYFELDLAHASPM